MSHGRAVVGDIRRQGLEYDPIPQMFEPLAQDPPRRAVLLARTSMDDPLEMAGSIQAAVRAVEEHAPVYAVTTYLIAGVVDGEYHFVEDAGDY